MIYRDTTAIDAVNNGRDTPDAFYEPGHPSVLMATSKWVSTDAWRGYTKVVPEDGFEVVHDSWMTGDWEDAPVGHSESSVEAKLATLERAHGNIYVVYAPTSNVFSTAYTVLVRDTTKPINKGKLIAGKTRRFDEPDGSFKVRYHATYVVSFDAKTGVYTLNTGGWHTMTTAKRITEALPAGWHVSRRNWILYLFRPNEEPLQLSDEPMEVQA